MLHSVFFALMVGFPTHPPHQTQILLAPPTPPASALPPPPPTGSLIAPSTCAPVRPALPLPFCNTVYWKQSAWLHMPCPRVGAWT